MARQEQAVVHHYTRIILKVTETPMSYHILQQVNPLTANNVRLFGESLLNRTERIATIMELLAVKGFSFRTEKNAIYAESVEVGAQAAKKYLLENGVRDWEFQVYLEYTRKWGMM